MSRSTFKTSLLLGGVGALAALFAYRELSPPPAAVQDPADDATPAVSDLDLRDPKARQAAFGKKTWFQEEARDALAAADGQKLRLRLSDLGTQLELPLAVRCVSSVCKGAAHFEVHVVSQGRDQVILERSVEAQEARRWLVNSAQITVGRDDPEAELQLRATVEPGTSGPVRLQPVWGAPLSLATERGTRPNILMVSIDALRADHLSCYGYERKTSPNLDALASAGVRFANATSHAPWTTPSHMSMLTSQIPTVHGSNQDFSAFSSGSFPRLPDEVVTLAEALRQSGYETRALTGGGTMSGHMGFDQGFDVYREGVAYFKAHDRVTTLLDSWLALGTRPLFLFWHTFEVHSPYTRLQYAADLLTPPQRSALEAFVAPSEETAFFSGDFHNAFAKKLKELEIYRKDVLVSLYDGGITRADSALGHMIETLRKLGLYEDTIVLVTADHGEEFADHSPDRIYNAHCTTVYDELLHVPLLLRVPGKYKPGTVVAHQARSMDIAPTLLDLLGIPIPAGMQGTSLARFIEGAKEPEQPSVAESTCSAPERKALRGNGYKLTLKCAMQGLSHGGITGACDEKQLFDLTRDPREQRDIAAKQPERVAELERLLREQLAVTAPKAQKSEVQLDDNMKDRLRALGYAE